MKLNRKGFTLVELAVVIVIIGVLAAIAVPRFRKAVERSKAGEAFNYLAAIRSAQERYASQYGTYAESVTRMDISMSDPKYYKLSDPVGDTDIESTWRMTLTRKGATAGFGSYTISFTQDGFDSDTAKSNIDNDINPMQN